MPGYNFLSIYNVQTYELLITGQNPASSAEAAKALLELLKN